MKTNHIEEQTEALLKGYKAWKEYWFNYYLLFSLTIGIPAACFELIMGIRELRPIYFLLFLFVLVVIFLPYFYLLSMYKRLGFEVLHNFIVHFGKGKNILCEGPLTATREKDQSTSVYAFLTENDFFVFTLPTTKEERLSLDVDHAPDLIIRVSDIVSISNDGKNLILNTGHENFVFKCKHPDIWNENIQICMEKCRVQNE